jgi:hypothetical protein
MTHSDLIPHRPYFFCGYFTDAESVPSIETYIYLGVASEVLGATDRGKREHVFQDAECYFEQQRGEISSTASPADRGLVLIADEDLLEPMVQDYAGLIEFVKRCEQDASE